jgi:hypothetical protein
MPKYNQTKKSKSARDAAKRKAVEDKKIKDALTKAVRLLSIRRIK